MSSISLRKVSFISWVLALFFFMSLMASPWTIPFVYSARNSKPEIIELSLEQLMEIEVSTVTGASKFAQKVTEAPSSVTIITSDDIARYGYRTLADALRSVRGFYVTNDRAYSYIGSRGFSRPGDYNTRVLLLIDGHRVNDGVFGTATIGQEFIIDIDLIERIEFIRGPGSSLYGNNAFFGVINVITKKGAKIDGFEVSASAESFDTYSQRITYGQKLENGIEFLVSGTRWASKGRDLYYKEYDDPTTNNGWSDRSDGENSGSVFGEFTFKDFTIQAAYVSRSKDAPTGYYGTLFDSSLTSLTDQRGHVDLQYRKNTSSGALITARLFYDYYHYYGDYVFDNPPVVTTNKDFARGRWWGAEIEFNSTFFNSHKVTAGANYENYLEQSQVNYDDNPFTSYLRDNRTSSIWAVHVQDQVFLRENLILNAGLR